MSKQLASLRQRALIKQSNRCYYCNCPLWEADLPSFLAEYRVSQRQAKFFQCTAEHLVARCDGGTNAEHNVVAACWFCNWARHRARKPLDSVRYRRRVQRRVALGRWLTVRLLST